MNFLSHETILIDCSDKHKTESEKLKPEDQIIDITIDSIMHTKQSAEALQSSENDEKRILVKVKDDFGFQRNVQLMYFVPADFTNHYSDKTLEELNEIYCKGYNHEYFNKVFAYQKLTDSQIETLFEIMKLKDISTNKDRLNNIFSRKISNQVDTQYIKK